MYGDNKNLWKKSDLLDMLNSLKDFIVSIIRKYKGNIEVIIFSVIIFLLICFELSPETINSYFNYLTLSDLTSKLQLFNGFNILVIITLLGILVYCLYLLFFIHNNGILQFAGTELNENKYTSTIFFITNILYAVSFLPLLYYLYINLNTSLFINLLQIVLLIIAPVVYFISNIHLTNISLISNESGKKQPYILNYDFIEKVRNNCLTEKKITNVQSNIHLNNLLNASLSLILKRNSIPNNRYIENINLKIAKNTYSHLTFNFMILFCITGVLFQFNLLTLLFIELTLIYVYLLLCTLEFIPRYRYDILFSNNKLGENGKCEKAYYYKVNDFYIIITKGEKPFWVNRTTILKFVPSDVY